MLQTNGFYRIEPEGSPIPIYVVSSLPSNPGRSRVADWFCWREVLTPRVIPKDGKKPERLALELGDETCGYESSLAFVAISREEAYRLAEERRRFSEEF